MSTHQNEKPSDSEINGRFDAANQIYRLGINIGTQFYERLIVISSTALGLLFSFKQGFFDESVPSKLSFAENICWLLSFLGFAVTLFGSMKRNYHAGNEAINLGHYMRYRAFKRIHPENKVYSENEEIADEAKRTAIKYRKNWSYITKISFYWAISFLLIFLIIDFVLKQITSLITSSPLLKDFDFLVLCSVFILNFIGSLLFSSVWEKEFVLEKSSGGPGGS